MILGSKRRRLLWLSLVLLCLLPGCGGQQANAGRYLEDLKPALLYWDILSQTYLEALEGVGDYLNNPTPERLEAARTGCSGAVEAISTLEVPASALTAEEEEAMGALDMDLTDYQALFDTLQYEKDTRLQSLSDTLERLDSAPAMDDVLEILNDLHLDFEYGERQLLQIGVNHLLCGVPEEALVHYRADFLAGPSGTRRPSPGRQTGPSWTNWGRRSSPAWRTSPAARHRSWGRSTLRRWSRPDTHWTTGDRLCAMQKRASEIVGGFLEHIMVR